MRILIDVQHYYAVQNNLGLFWGTQYEDGKVCEKGWGPINKADTSDAIVKTTDFTYENSPHTEDLRRGKLVKIRRVRKWEIEELALL